MVSSLLFLCIGVLLCPNLIRLCESAVPPPSLHDISLSKTPLSIHVFTIPAFGHYMTIRDAAIALSRRGHNMTFVSCDQTKKFFDSDNLSNYGFNWLSAGPCEIFQHRDAVISEVISHESPETLKMMLDSMTKLSLTMCEHLMPHYQSLSVAGNLPSLIFFDADTYCSMDISIKFRIPRVARVGTGTRDTFSANSDVPYPSSGSLKPVSLFDRVKNALLLQFNSYVVSPLVLPSLYGSHRSLWLSPASDNSDEYTLRYLYGQGTYEQEVHLDESHFHPRLLWDAVPTLYNSHFGLEIPRVMQPFEHLVGHTSDFEGLSAGVLDPWLLSWLQGRPDVPVVYIGLGTLSVAPAVFFEAFVAQLRAYSGARFVWSLRPEAFPEGKVPDYISSFFDNVKRECSASSSDSGERILKECADLGGAGSLLVLSHVSQVPLLLHESVSLFLTHGGMNGVSEATFTRVPTICIPFFSDQPFNCARLQDRGAGLLLQWRTVASQPHALAAALDHFLLPSNSAVLDAAKQSLNNMWTLNLMAGGWNRVIDVVEAHAMLPYGAHLAQIPPHLLGSTLEATDRDVELVFLMFLFTFIAVVWFLCTKTCCCRACCYRKKQREFHLKNKSE